MECRQYRPLVQPQSALLNLPSEIRLKILELSIGSPVLDIGESDSNTHMGSLMPSMFAVTATCRLLYLEGSEIQYRNTDLTFRSANALLKFFGQRRPMLESVGRVCLHCGPAKHGLITAKTQNKAALRLLADHARRLVDLKLVFGPYWGMHSDRQLLSSYWYYSLYRLRPSVRLSLVVHPPYWKAPIGIEFLTDEAQSKLQRRIQSTEDSFRQVLCQPESYRRGLSPIIAKDTIRSLKRATLPKRHQENPSRLDSL